MPATFDFSTLSGATVVVPADVYARGQALPPAAAAWGLYAPDEAGQPQRLALAGLRCTGVGAPAVVGAPPVGSLAFCYTADEADKAAIAARCPPLPVGGGRPWMATATACFLGPDAQRHGAQDFVFPGATVLRSQAAVPGLMCFPVTNGLAQCAVNTAGPGEPPQLGPGFFAGQPIPGQATPGPVEAAVLGTGPFPPGMAGFWTTGFGAA